MTKNTVRLEKINLMNDAMFKAIIRSEEAREVVSSFLHALTGIPKELLLNAHYVGGEYPKHKLSEKGKTSDVIVETKENNRIIIEMNQNDDTWRFDRNSSYAFTGIIESTKPNMNNYPTTIIINVNNFNRFHTKRPIQHFLIRDEDGNIETFIYHSIHLVLDNIVNSKYNIDREIKSFAKFLKTSSIDELEKEFKEDEDYMACIRKVEDLSTDPNFIGYYDIEEAKRQEIEASYATGEMKGFEKGKEEGKIEGIEQGKLEGIEQGKIEGIEQGKIEGIEQGKLEGEKENSIKIAKNMLEEKLDINLIKKLTGLTESEIEQLR